MTVTNILENRERLGDDATLAEAAKRDHAAFDRLYRRYVDRVYRYCYSRTGNSDDAEDLTAQTFLAALESIGSYRGKGTFAAWLFGIAWRKCKDHHRRRYARPQEALEDVLPVPDHEAPNLEQHADHQQILDCVQRVRGLLSDDRLEALELRFFAGLSTRETAAVMHRSQGAVKMLLSRAVADLRERCLDERA